MTSEEAIFCEKSYIGETNCVDCKYYGTETCQSRESHKMAVKALEQESVLDKVKQAREEIENEVKFWSEPSKYNVDSVVNARKAKIQSYKHCLEIIDKLIAESEEK